MREQGSEQRRRRGERAGQRAEALFVKATPRVTMGVRGPVEALIVKAGLVVRKLLQPDVSDLKVKRKGGLSLSYLCAMTKALRIGGYSWSD